MTLCRTLLQLMALGSFLILAGVTPAQAEEASEAKRCPPVYGTWRTTHVMDKFGHPQELDPPKGRRRELMEAPIDEHKAVLTWNGKRQPVTEGRKKRTFKRVYRYEQTSYHFDGLDQDGQYVGADTNYKIEKSHQDDRRYLDVLIRSRIDPSGDNIAHVLMVKTK